MSLPRLAFALFSLLLLSAPPAAAEYFTIQSFSSALVVDGDGDLTVREEIDVRFSSARHGIYRDLPFRYADDLGKKVSTPLQILSVADGEGSPRRHKTIRSGDTLRVRIGHPRKYVDGRQVYVITYRVSNALLSFPDRDELAWNVTGNSWNVPMEEVSASVTLPEGSEGGIVDGACYTGPRGSVGDSCTFVKGPRSARFRTTEPLSPGEGLTVAVGWRKGVTAPPSLPRRLLLALGFSENWIFLLPLLGITPMYLLWRSSGRDPSTGPVAVMYGPPGGGEGEMTAAEVGSLVDEKFDSRDLAGSIVGLAVKGYVTIEEAEESGFLFRNRDWFLRREREADDRLTPFEKDLMRHLFPPGLPGVLISSLKNSFYVHLDGLRTLLFSGLVDKGFFRTSPDTVRMWYRSAGLVIAVAGALAGYNAQRFFPMTSLVKNLIACLLPGAALMLFARHMPAKTRRGAWAAAEIRGFTEFLSRAEKDRLERMGDLNLFEKFLPYAIALDVSDRWAQAFEGIEQAPPRWYAAPSGWHGGFRPAAFHSSFGSALSTMRSSMYSAPRSSGGGSFSGGGGFSGGGFGGGGGGSW